MMLPVKEWIEKSVARLWNRRIARHRASAVSSRVLDLAMKYSEDTSARGRIMLSLAKRAEHIAILGRTGAGKSSLIKYLAKQDIEAGRGAVYFDLHGDAMPFLLATFAAEERRLGKDLSERLVVIEPADPEFSVGLNLLEQNHDGGQFLQISEFTQTLKQRWQLDTFGARTDELLRNALFAVAANDFTLLEVAPFLAHGGFRARCLKTVSNAELKQYFEIRYDQASEPMRAAMREPILNKISAFTADPRFRLIVGQQHSTFSIAQAMDRGQWVVLNLHKGKLGEQAATFGSLFLTTVKNALFARARRELFTVYADEIQNFVSFGGNLETMLSEARKFGVGFVTANQFLDQYPAEMRAAILAVGTHLFFQLSPQDAHQIATALDGGKPLAERLKNLPRRHMIVKTGSERWAEGVVPTLAAPNADVSDLYNRCRARWARKRSEIEEEIRRRQLAVTQSTSEALNDWE
jgi:energy-coupling factor transporter ATP-binding protein EcfA2